MNQNMNPFVGAWTYRSLLNDPNPLTAFNDLKFGIGLLNINEASPGILGGVLGGDGWMLHLHGSMSFGNPSQIRFQGKGIIGAEEWIYDYVAWLVPAWPNSTERLQTPALVGSIVRTIPHSGDGGTVHPAGVVASFYCVRES